MALNSNALAKPLKVVLGLRFTELLLLALTRNLVTTSLSKTGLEITTTTNATADQSDSNKSDKRAAITRNKIAKGLADYMTSCSCSGVEKPTGLKRYSIAKMNRFGYS